MSKDKFEKAYVNGKITNKFKPMLIENYFENKNCNLPKRIQF